MVRETTCNIPYVGEMNCSASLPASASGKGGYYWTTADLVRVGVFAALSRVIGLAIALAGGGMNPVALLLRNAATTALLVVFLQKTRRKGALLLFVGVQGLLSLLLMGSGLMTLPGVVLAALVVESVFFCLGGYHTVPRVLLAVLCFETLARAVSLGVSYLFLRESPAMFMVAFVIVGFAYLGCPLGLWIGGRLIHELRAAGVIRT
jgi:hypothetical protein